jgi:hypothetical protein
MDSLARHASTSPAQRSTVQQQPQPQLRPANCAQPLLVGARKQVDELIGQRGVRRREWRDLVLATELTPLGLLLGEDSTWWAWRKYARA